MILLAFGSNVSGPWGNPRETVLRAARELPLHNVRILKMSSLLETAPFGVLNQPPFINAVAHVDTVLPAEALLHALHMIERRAGRKRLKRWGPRTLDIDILDYNGLYRKPSSTSIKPLALPHPGIAERSFVLVPLAEIAPGWRHPLTRETAKLTLRQLRGLNAA